MFVSLCLLSLCGFNPSPAGSFLLEFPVMGQALDFMSGCSIFLGQVSKVGLLLLLFSGNWAFKGESVQGVYGPLLHCSSESRGKLLETSSLERF